MRFNKTWYWGERRQPRTDDGMEWVERRFFRVAWLPSKAPPRFLFLARCRYDGVPYRNTIVGPLILSWGRSGEWEDMEPWREDERWESA